MCKDQLPRNFADRSAKQPSFHIESIWHSGGGIANRPNAVARSIRMKTLTIGDVTITSIIERDGPWRRPEEMFPGYDPAIGRRHLAELDREVFDPASGKMVITYQTYIVRTPKHTILIDTCTGEDKGYPPPMDFPKQPWLDGFKGAGLRFEDIDYV